MSSRCNVTIFERCEIGWREGPMLYHHWDGYPENMLPKLEHLLVKAIHTLSDRGYRVDALKLAAMVVAGSVSNDVPTFYPCHARNEDSDYQYDVYVDGAGGLVEATDRDGVTVESVVIDVGGDE